MKRMWNVGRSAKGCNEDRAILGRKWPVSKIANAAGEYQDIRRRRCNQCHAKEKEEEQGTER
jgi:hypothetical protein